MSAVSKELKIISLANCHITMTSAKQSSHRMSSRQSLVWFCILQNIVLLSQEECGYGLGQNLQKVLKLSPKGRAASIGMAIKLNKV